MIVVIEGPSAAGKTSWIAAHSEDALVVAEYAGPAQVDADEIDTANYWAEANAVRWATAIQAEPCTQIVLCDTDPFKLHYTWSLWRLGHASTREWNLARDANRRMFTAGRLGIADVVLVSIPDSDALARRRASDSNRTRRNFELHKQLSEPLREWYGAISQLDPRRVCWSFPDAGLSGITPLGTRSPRSGTEAFDNLMTLLPSK